MVFKLTANATVSYMALTGLCGCAQPLLGPMTRESATASGPGGNHWAWAECLHQSVRDGRVRYDRLLEDPRPLDRVLSRLAVEPVPDATGPARVACLVNAYNAFAMRAGLECYRRAGGNAKRSHAPKENEFRFQLQGRNVTLADVRNALLIGPMPDVRILLALSPARADIPLSDQPFDPDTLDRKLAEVAAAAMSNPDVVAVDHANQTLWVTDVIGQSQAMLVRWYRQRMGTDRGELFNALLELSDDAGRDRLNTAVGYRIVARPPERRLNVYDPAAAASP